MIRSKFWCRYIAVYDYIATNPEELEFSRRETIFVIAKTKNQKFFKGELTRKGQPTTTGTTSCSLKIIVPHPLFTPIKTVKKGIFPAEFVEIGEAAPGESSKSLNWEARIVKKVPSTKGLHLTSVKRYGFAGISHSYSFRTFISSTHLPIFFFLDWLHHFQLINLI